MRWRDGFGAWRCTLFARGWIYGREILGRIFETAADLKRRDCYKEEGSIYIEYSTCFDHRNTSVLCFMPGANCFQEHTCRA